MSHLPEVRTLFAIADNVWLRPELSSCKSSRTNTRHDAKSLMRLVESSSLVVQNRYSRKTEKLVDYYRLSQTWDRSHMQNYELLNDKLWELYKLVDELFFFKTLTRRVEGPNGMMRVVGFDITQAHNYTTEYAAFDLETRCIKVWTRSQEGGRYRFEHLMYSIVHEMVHGFLETFSDRRHRKHEDRVAVDGGHGKIFWKLLRFVAETIFELTNSSTWRDQCDRGEVECLHSMTKVLDGTDNGPSGFPTYNGFPS